MRLYVPEVIHHEDKRHDGDTMSMAMCWNESVLWTAIPLSEQVAAWDLGRTADSSNGGGSIVIGERG
jgi:hypothetical protein